jgi:hypothetical protein
MSSPMGPIVSKAREYLEQARAAETPALALYPAEQAAETLLLEGAEGEPDYEDTVYELFHFWEEKNLTGEQEERAVRAAKQAASYQRLLQRQSRRKQKARADE